MNYRTMSIQEKFEKAVNVIRNLPKNGSYQPSHEMQLRFYAYYKQATEGPNRQIRPSFWEVVKRAKWDAWNKLGEMTKNEAMINYVEELRKIVETMAYTDNVANFLNSLDNFYDNVPAEDLEMLVGPIIEKIRSRPNSPLSGSPLASRDTSPSRDSSPLHLHPRANNVGGATKHITSSLETSPASSYSASPQPPDTDDDEDEHFLDTQTEPDRGKEGTTKKMRPDESSVNRSLTKTVTTERPYPCPGTVGAVVEEIKGSSLETDLAKNRLSRLKNAAPDLERNLAKFENCNGIGPRDVQSEHLPQGTSAVTSETFKKAIASLTREMESLQQRMAALETQEILLKTLNPNSSGRSQEIPANSVRERSNDAVSKWWDLSLSTTTALLMWPVVILLMSHWLSNRRRR